MPSSSEWTKSQVDRLGDRLRKGDISDDDLRLLDTYRRSFTDAYEVVVARIRALAPTFQGQSLLEPTGRPAKSTTSIIDKLRRESIRLSQMQDIAGCRLTVTDINRQDYIVAKIAGLFEKVSVVDRREGPSHGYRAVHIIAEHSGRLVEIQIRTFLQHLWAETSEKFSDIIDSGLKYGTGDEEALRTLSYTSDEIRKIESQEHVAYEVISNEVRSTIDKGQKLSPDEKQKVIEVLEMLASRKKRIESLVLLLRDVTLGEKRSKDDFSD